MKIHKSICLLFIGTVSILCAVPTGADGAPFKNQGDCVQYVNNGR